MLEIRNLTKRFARTTAVGDVSFVVEPCEVTGYLGPNGAGKTTATTPSRRQFLRGVSGLATSALASGRIVAAAETFSFAAVNDIHLLDQGSLTIVRRAVDLINADRRVAFVLALGDLTTSGTREQLQLVPAAFSALKVPLHPVPGNHEESAQLYEEVLGPRNYRFEHGGWHFLMIDTGRTVETELPAEQIEWIRTQLAHIPPHRPIVLGSHHPFNPHTQRYRVRNADAVLAEFKNHRLRAVVSGHYHGNQVERSDGVLFTTTTCLASTRSNHDGSPTKGFRLFQCSADQISDEYVPVH